jgi:hypothetical protein
VAAPPHDGPNKGLDDHLGAGHSLDDLVVQGRQVDAWGQRAWLNYRGLRKDGKDRAADMLYGLGYACDNKGQFTGSLSRFARVMNIKRRRVGRGVHDLEKLGAITINGDLSIRRDWFSKALRWEDQPVITLIPELRGEDGPGSRLGELLR